MIEALLFGLTLITALGCGLMAGFFFAFSACVMKALSRLPQSQGIAAMQSINVTVINPLDIIGYKDLVNLSISSNSGIVEFSASLWSGRDGDSRLRLPPPFGYRTSSGRKQPFQTCDLSGVVYDP